MLSSPTSPFIKLAERNVCSNSRSQKLRMHHLFGKVRPCGIVNFFFHLELYIKSWNRLPDSLSNSYLVKASTLYLLLNLRIMRVFFYVNKQCRNLEVNLYCNTPIAVAQGGGSFHQQHQQVKNPLHMLTLSNLIKIKDTMKHIPNY